MFNDVHDENTFEGSQIFDAAQHIQDETLVVFHVGSMNLQQVIETARYVVAFGDFRNIGDDPGKFGGYIVIYPLQLDFTKDHKTLVQFIGIQYGDVLLDIAVRFQSFQSFEYRCGRQADFGGQFFGRQPGIFLQNTENLQVYFI